MTTHLIATISLATSSAPAGLTAGGWVVMLLATGSVTLLFIGCLLRVLRNHKPPRR
jgi:hypothetical protein